MKFTLIEEGDDEMKRVEFSDYGRNTRFPPGWWIGPILIVSILFWLIGAYAVFAQSTSGAVSGAAANNQNTNAAGAIAAGNSVTYYGAPPEQTINGTTNYKGSYDVNNVPGVSAPGIITAHNCALGVSAGGSWLGGGLSLGGSYIDKSCQLVSQAAALNTLAGSSVAIRHLAKDPDMCDTLLSAGLVSGRCGNKVSRPRGGVATQPATASTKSVRAPFSKCAYDPSTNKLTFKKSPGVDSAVALAACKQAAGL